MSPRWQNCFILRNILSQFLSIWKSLILLCRVSRTLEQMLYKNRNAAKIALAAASSILYVLWQVSRKQFHFKIKDKFSSIFFMANVKFKGLWGNLIILDAILKLKCVPWLLISIFIVLSDFTTYIRYKVMCTVHTARKLSIRTVDVLGFWSNCVGKDKVLLPKWLNGIKSQWCGF